MIDYEHFDLFQQDSVDKQLTIQYDNTTITNEDIFEQTMTLDEALCSQKELRFGSCEASVIKFKIANIFLPMYGKEITTKIVPEKHNAEPLQIGKYKVETDTPTADRQWREITAYDAMHDIVNADVAEWYNTILPNDDSTVTLKQFRQSFIKHFGLEEVIPKDGLANDNMTVRKTIGVVASSETSGSGGTKSVIGEALSGNTVVTKMCEINGCFGHIGRDGKFHYIYLPQDIQGLYPSNTLFPDHAPDYLSQAETGHLYPQDPKGIPIGGKGTYIDAKYDDYICRTINQIQIRQKENDIGVIYPEKVNGTPNTYIIEDNFLVYGMSSEELKEVAKNIFERVKGVIYRPFEANIQGNPCFEVGDPIRLVTRYELIESYILERHLKGIQALRDTFSAKGVERYSEKVNSVHSSILQLKGKTNTLTRNIEETNLAMADMDKALRTEISVTAAGLSADIQAEKTRAEGEEQELSNKIDVTAEGLRADIQSETERATGEEESLSNRITVTAEGLTASIEAEKTRATGEEERLSTDIIALAGQIILKVDSDGNIAQVELSANADTGSVFKVQAQNISLSAEEAISLLTGGNLNLTGKHIVINSTNFNVDENGNVQCHNITAFSISGEAVNQFNNTVSDTEAMRLAREAISNAASAASAASSAASTAQSAANKAQETANTANSTVSNLNSVIIPQINGWIRQMSTQLQALGQPGIS